MSDRGIFDLGDILTITTGVLLVDIGKVYEILNYLTGDNLYTHQLPRAGAQCRPHILEQYPDLATIEEPELDGWDECRAWVRQQKERLGVSSLSLQPIPAAQRVVRDPLLELYEMMPDKPVIVLATEGHSDER